MRCALHRSVPKNHRGAWVEVEHFGYYDESLGKDRVQLSDHYCENPPLMASSWAHSYKVVTSKKGVVLREVQYDEETGRWVTDKECPRTEQVEALVADEPRRNVNGMLSFLTSVQDDAMEPEPESESFAMASDTIPSGPEVPWSEQVQLPHAKVLLKKGNKNKINAAATIKA